MRQKAWAPLTRVRAAAVVLLMMMMGGEGGLVGLSLNQCGDGSLQRARGCREDSFFQEAVVEWLFNEWHDPGYQSGTRRGR